MAAYNYADPGDLVRRQAALLASGDEYLDGKSISAWYRAKQVLGL
jgi:hypothetical protein